MAVPENMIILTLIALATSLALEDDGISVVPWQKDPQKPTPPPRPWPWNTEFVFNKRGKTSDGEELFQSDILLTVEQWEAVRERKAVNNDGARWPEGSDGYPLVPYVYGDSEVDREAVSAGIEHWMEHTCIKFVETTNTAQPHLQFIQGGGCWSYVGVASSTGQQISIGGGCTLLGIVAHEMGHAMGFFHEQSRSDRDDYVSVKYDNMADDIKFAFDKYDTNNYDVLYDYGSAMHYGSFFFSENGKMTIVTKDPFGQELINQAHTADGLSHRDKFTANRMYKCIDKWLLQCDVMEDPCQNEGYLGAKCLCVCPPGTSGYYCETITDDYYAHLLSEHSATITTEKTISHADGKFTKKIVAPKCKKVKITFTSFDLYEKYTNGDGLSFCYYEFIFLRFGSDLTEGDNYCGKDITAGQSFTSETDTMVLFAEHKYSGISDGWSAKVEFVSDPGCTVTTLAPTTSAPETPAPTTSAPENLVECAKKPKTLKLKAGESIQIQSPNYPDNYPGTKCGWEIKGDGIKVVKVSCSNFGMEAPKKGKCKDFLKIGKKKFCGENGPVDVSVSVKKLGKLSFKSNKKNSGTGFSCTVTAIPN